jgi:hypothetical protein
MPLWSFQVFGYSILANQLTDYITVFHEPHIQGLVEEISLGFLQQNIGIQQDMEGAYEALG